MKIACINLSNSPLIRAVQKARQEGAELLKKIVNVSSKIIVMIGQIFSFPLRYFGSKTWSIPGVIFRSPYLLFRRIIQKPVQYSLKRELFGSGYHFHFQKLLSPCELEEYLPYVLATAFVHKCDLKWIKPLGFSIVSPKELGIEDEKMEEHENCYFDPISGLKIALVEKNNTIIVVFGARDSSRSELPDDSDANEKLVKVTSFNCIKNWLGATPLIYNQASNFFQKLQKTPRLQGKKVVFVGQCSGGSLGAFLSLKYKLEAFCFNTMPFGAGLQRELGHNALSEADRYITHITVKGDYLSDPPVVGIFDKILNGLGIKTAGNFGKRYLIPSAYKSRGKTHNFAVGSVMQHLGYDKRTMPEEIPNIKCEF